MAEAAADQRPDLRCVLADPAVNTRVSSPASDRGQRADGLADAAAEHVDGERGGIVGRPPIQELLHVAGRSGQAQQARLLVDEMLEGVGIELVAPGQVDAARPGRDRRSASPSPRRRSGVSPMVVSTERPSATAARLAPLPRWAIDGPSQVVWRRCGRRRTRTRARGSRSAPRPRRGPNPAGRAAGRPRASCGGTRCRSRPPASPAGSGGRRHRWRRSRRGGGAGRRERPAPGWIAPRRRRSCGRPDRGRRAPRDGRRPPAAARPAGAPAAARRSRRARPGRSAWPRGTGSPPSPRAYRAALTDDVPTFRQRISSLRPLGAQGVHVQSRISGRSSRCSRTYRPWRASISSQWCDELVGSRWPDVRAAQRLLAEVVPADAVAHHHVERRRRGPLLLVATHVEAVRVGLAVQQLVERAGVAVEREHDMAVRREQVVEREGVHAVRMVVGRQHLHEVDDVDEPDAQRRGRGDAGATPPPPLPGSGCPRRWPAPRRDPHRRTCSPTATRPRRASSVPAPTSMSSHCSCGCLSMTIRFT